MKLGQRHTLETRQKMSEAKLGKKNYWWGKKLSPGHRRKISDGQQGRRGEKAYNWRGGRAKHGDGYIEVLRPEHPNANKKGYILEHRLVVSEHLGRPLKPGEMVHHINGIRDDNCIENLELIDQHKRQVCPNCGWPMKLSRFQDHSKDD